MGCGGEGAEGGNGISQIVGQTGGDGVSAAENGSFSGQCRCVGQPIPTTGSDGFSAPLRADLRAARGLLACSMRRQAVQQLPQLTAGLAVPSLWIAGSRDTVMAPRYVRHLAGYAPEHQFVLLEGAGHLPMRQRPEDLAAVLRPWLAALPAGREMAAESSAPSGAGIPAQSEARPRS